MKWSELLDVNWGVSSTVTAGGKTGSTAGKPVLEDLTWTQRLDKSVTALFSRISTGKPIANATVDFTTTSNGASSKTYFEIAFDDTLLTSLDIGSGDPRAQLSGASADPKISMTYTENDSGGTKKGSLSATYDLTSRAGSIGNLAAVFALGSSGPNAMIPSVPEPGRCVSVLGGLGLLGWCQRRERARGEATARH